ncbi:unnamed protein product [Periconia digitata]|uniref:Uncharacterized protein n=1 Tax=Periconia digitata TaxID=1303443 RepID=A0A9W4UIB1_9PLEO|nr:unnamed protein product [Periconia digitata]
MLVPPQTGTTNTTSTVSPTAAAPLTINNASASSTLPLIPTAPPPEAFTVPISPKVSPWNHPWPAPTTAMSDQDACPVDWNFILSKAPHIRQDDVATWESRKPGAKDGEQPSWNELSKVFDVTLEAVRKRAKKVTLALFKLTGVYFSNSAAGLEEFGISKAPTGLQEKKKKKAAATMAPVGQGPQIEDIKQAMIQFILKPPASECNDRCKECCTSGKCYDHSCSIAMDCCKQCCGEIWYCHGCDDDPEGDCDMPFCGEEVCQCPCVHKPTPEHSEARWKAYLQNEGAPFGCPDPGHQNVVTIYVPTKDIVPYCAKPLPNTVLLNVELEDFKFFLKYLPSTDGEHGRSMGQIFRAYCCARALNSDGVAEKIIKTLWNILYKEQELLRGYRSGLYAVMSRVDVPLRIMDFEAEDIAYLYTHTKPSDPIRVSLADIVRSKGEVGLSKVREELGRYPGQFLWDIGMRVSSQPNENPQTSNSVMDLGPGALFGHLKCCSTHTRLAKTAEELRLELEDAELCIWGEYRFLGWKESI